MWSAPRCVFNYLWSSMGPDLGDMSKSSGLNDVFLGSGELHQPPWPAVLLQVQSHRSHAEVQETLQGREHHLPHAILCHHPEQDSQTHPLPGRGRWVLGWLDRSILLTPRWWRKSILPERNSSPCQEMHLIIAWELNEKHVSFASHKDWDQEEMAICAKVTEHWFKQL